MTLESSPMQVLLFEDDADIAGLLIFRLKHEGYAVEHLSDGAAAIERLDKAGIPDLVVSDVMMPYRDGFEVLAEMRRREHWKDVPVLLLTSRNADRDIVRGLELGANDYLAKPFRPAELIARVRRLLNKRS